MAAFAILAVDGLMSSDDILTDRRSKAQHSYSSHSILHIILNSRRCLIFFPLIISYRAVYIRPVVLYDYTFLLANVYYTVRYCNCMRSLLMKPMSFTIALSLS